MSSKVLYDLLIRSYEQLMNWQLTKTQA